MNCVEIKNIFKKSKILSSSDLRSLGTAKIELKGLDYELSLENIRTLYILEEADDLSEESQKYIYSTLLQNRKKLYFILICNNFEKLEKFIQENFRIFHLKKLKEENLMERFRFILKKEKIYFEEKAIWKIIDKINGDMRQGLNYLQSIGESYGEITLNNYNLFFDIFNPLEKYNFLDACFAFKFKEMLDIMDKLLNEGYSFFEILEYFEDLIYSYKDKINPKDKYDEDNIFNILYFDQKFRLRLIELIQSQKINISNNLCQITFICSELIKIFKESIKKIKH